MQSALQLHNYLDFQKPSLESLVWRELHGIELYINTALHQLIAGKGNLERFKIGFAAKVKSVSLTAQVFLIERINEWIMRRGTAIQKLVDVSSPNLTEEDAFLKEYLPITTYPDFRILWMKFKKLPAIASVVGFEGEIPNTKGFVSVREAEISMFKLGIAHTYTENDLIMKHELERSGDQNLIKAFRDAIFGTIEGLKPRIIGLADLLMWQVLVTGGCNYLDPRTHITARLQYPIEPSLFPGELVGATRWGQLNTADGFQNLRLHLLAFYNIHNRYPDAVLIPKKLHTNLKNQVSTRQHAIALTTSQRTVEDFIVNQETFDSLREEWEIPPFVIYDRTVVVESAEGLFTETRLLPDDTYVFATKAKGMNTMGERAFGPVPSNDFKPGIYTFPEEISKEPPIDRSVGTATEVSAVWDAKLLGAWKVNRTENGNGRRTAVAA